MVASDEEQIERLRDWWSEHGRSVIAGVVLGIAGLLGWQGWQVWQDNRVASAAAAFAQLEQMASNGDDGVVERAQAVATAHDGTSYTVLAWLIGAGAAVENGDLETAAAYLERARASTDRKPLVATVDLRLARVLWAEGQHQAALDRLTSPPAGFEGLFAELRGDVLADQGELVAARQAYEAAVAESAESAGNGLLQMKLDSLPAAGEES
ncbi:MAG: tetratricopeptide repeat protein [Halothiobacillaceae bacterium]|nr:tetratricopeptide repeat protein [Halothiobacillaceae bacterium]HER19515.1 tetratricopeptide repeat protein [Chromatiales bacterium]